jgi:rubrerythrin
MMDKQRIDENEKLRAAIEAVEWIEPGLDYSCPWCGFTEENGHAADCPRQAALGEVE